MVISQENDSATHYMKEYKKQLTGSDLALTGSNAIDALISSKKNTMVMNNIHFRYSSYPLHQLPINELDFCTILGNILDNAIEGTLRIKEPAKADAIHLAFSQSWNMFYLFCTNECLPDTILTENGKWKSAKNDRDTLHAIGIKSIEHLVKKYNGHCRFSVQENHFHVKIVFPFEEIAEGTEIDV